MKILIISASDPYKISGTVARDIYNGLNKIKSNEVKLLVRHCFSQEKNVVSFLSNFEFFLEKTIYKIKKNAFKFGFLSNKKPKCNPDYHIQNIDQTITFFKTHELLKRVDMKPDVIIILFMQGFLSYKNIFELNNYTGASIYLYPMDMASFTGGCHYAWDCSGYLKQCGSCPGLYSKNQKDQSYFNNRYKSKYMQNTDVSLFAANSQLADQLKKSSIFQNKKIISGIYPVPDKEIFKILSKNEARNFFDIANDEIVLFFGSVSLAEKRKGIEILNQSFNLLYEKLLKTSFDTNKILLLHAGYSPSIDNKKHSFRMKDLGFINDYNVLSKAYNVSDFFICPSIEDSGPTMILQSILCGTPTISFDIGYATDFVRHEINGFIAFEKNAEKLSESLFKAINQSSDSYDCIKKEVIKTSEKIDQYIVLNKIVENIRTK